MRNEENLLVPFQVSQLPASPWLVFAPHADDETFGMGGSLLRASRLGMETHVVVVTDGALGGDRADLVQVRNREASRATAMLGVRSLQCWTEKDRGLQINHELIERIAGTIRDLEPASVFFPGPMELHPDHRSTALLVWAALQSLRDDGFRPQAYAYEVSVQSPINCLIDITAVIAVKQAAMAVYASQNSQNDYPQLVSALNKARTFTLPAEVEYAEGFFHFTGDDLALPLYDVMQGFFEMYR
ncbi:MAG: PIG-L deacetylase family protein [Pseudohongiellaceae bacterium]